MTIDIPNQLNAVDRKVEKLPADNTAGERIGVSLRRTYNAPIDDVWNALTDASRIKRWFMPVSGDLRVGGTFQLEGNAGGEILECDRPRTLRVTWGGPTSIVELRLSATDGGTSLQLEHNVPLEMAQSGAGALWVGPGWDGAVMGLGLYLTEGGIDDPAAMAASIEVQEFSQQSVYAWAEIIRASGTATADELAQATAISLAQFAPDLAAQREK